MQTGFLYSVPFVTGPRAAPVQNNHHDITMYTIKYITITIIITNVNTTTATNRQHQQQQEKQQHYNRNKVSTSTATNDCYSNCLKQQKPKQRLATTCEHNGARCKPRNPWLGVSRMMVILGTRVMVVAVASRPSRKHLQFRMLYQLYPSLISISSELTTTKNVEKGSEGWWCSVFMKIEVAQPH